VSVVVVGLNHRTVPLDILERMAVNRARLPKALRDLALRPYLDEAVLLSTCMRTEVYASVDRFHGALQDVRHFLAELSDVPPDLFVDHLYAYYEDAAASHLFRVASGLDSAVLGEGEVLGQVKSAWEAARQEGVAGPALGRLFRHAVEVGKRARAETGIARGTTSLSQAAVGLAAATLGPEGLAGKSLLVLGVGDMGVGMAQTLAELAHDDQAEILVANRTWTKAADLARRCGGRAVELGALATALESVDVLLTSTGSTQILIEADDVATVMAARGGRPLLIVDVALPRDVDPSAGRIPGVTLLDLDDLKAFAEAAVANRRAEVSKVEDLIAEQVDKYLGAAAEREVAPLIAALREQAEEIRFGELARFRARFDALSPREREAVEAVTRGLVAKLLHAPTVRLKDAAGTPQGDRLAEAIQTLFDLP
jgi:glutamyl-tRNA reductase